MIPVTKTNQSNQEQKVRVNHPDDLHLVTGLGSNLKWVGYIGDMAKQRHEEYEKTHGHPFRADVPSTPATIYDPQKLWVDSNTRSAYLNNDWDTLKRIQNQADQDLQPIYDLLLKDPDHAWVAVRDEDTSKWYHMAYASNGSYLWTYTPSIDVGPGDLSTKHGINTDNVPFSCKSTYGTYSKSANVAGTHTHWWALTKAAPPLILSATLSSFVCKVLKVGLDFAATQLEMLLSSAAAEIGLEAVFTFAAPVLPYVIPAIIFIIIFVGVYFLWNWFHKKFTILVSVYNWDEKNDMYVYSQAMSNADNPGKDPASTLNIKVVKALPPNSPVPIGDGTYQIPSDIGKQLMHTLQWSVSYVMLVYENDSQFAQGLSFAIQVGSDDHKSGFTYAFQCPWISNNAHYMEGNMQNPDSFLSKARSHWIESTNNYIVKCDNTSYNIEAQIDKLTGGDNDTYNVAIHINKHTFS